MKTKSRLIRTMQYGFAVVVAVLLVVCIVAYRSVIASTVSARWAQHTTEVLGHLAKLRSATENIESGYRDFALSGDDAFLALSRTEISVVAQEQKILRALTADNSNQQRRLGVVADLTQQIIQRGEALVHVRQAGATEAARDTIHEGKGDPSLNEFRAVAGDMDNEEHRLLAERNADTERRYRQVKI